MTNTEHILVTKTERTQTNNRTDWMVYGRTAENDVVERKIVGHRPYFLIRESEYQVNKLSIQQNARISNVEETDVTALDGEPCRKIEVLDSQDVREVKGAFKEPLSADCAYHIRCRVDYDIYTGMSIPEGGAASAELSTADIAPADAPPVDYRVQHIDIEVSDENGFPFPEDAAESVLSIVAWDSHLEKYAVWLNAADGLDTAGAASALQNTEYDLGYVEVFDDEFAMLTNFVSFIGQTNPDIVTGWNYIEFDMKYLLNRMNRLGVDPAHLGRGDKGVWYDNSRDNLYLPGRNAIDLLEAYKQSTFGEKESYSLDNIAEDELGERKTPFEGTYIDLYRDDGETFVEYALKDVDLTRRLDAKRDILGFLRNLQREIGCELTDAMYPKDMVPVAFRREFARRGFGTPDYRGRWRSIEGAFVLEPYNGIAENVVSLDLASLYPNTIGMCNLSPETKVSGTGAVMLREDDVSVLDVPEVEPFRQDKEGIASYLALKYLGLKSDLKQKKKEMSADDPEYEAVCERYDVTKAVVNSLYGILSYKWFWWVECDVAEACTRTAQQVTKRTRDWVNENTEGDVIYGDTDSVYIHFPTVSEDKAKELAIEIVQTLNTEVYPTLAKELGLEVTPDECLWEIEPERYISRYFQAGRKKRYAYLAEAKYGEDEDGNEGWQEFNEPKVKISGFEYQRSDTSQLASEVQEDIISMILDERPIEDIQDRVYRAANELRDALDDWERIGIPQGMKKKLPRGPQDGENDNYYRWSTKKDAPMDAHPRAAYYANEAANLGLGKGDKPKRIHLDPARSQGRDVIAFEEMADLAEVRHTVSVDVPAMLEKSVIKPVDNILDALGVDASLAARGQQQTSLGGFA